MSMTTTDLPERLELHVGRALTGRRGTDLPPRLELRIDLDRHPLVLTLVTALVILLLAQGWPL